MAKLISWKIFGMSIGCLFTLAWGIMTSVFLETFRIQSTGYYLHFYRGWQFTKATMAKITPIFSTWQPRRGITFCLGLPYEVNYFSKFSKYFTTRWNIISFK